MPEFVVCQVEHDRKEKVIVKVKGGFYDFWHAMDKDGEPANLPAKFTWFTVSPRVKDFWVASEVLKKMEVITNG